MTTPLRSQGIALPCPRASRALLPNLLWLFLFLLLSAFVPVFAQPTLTTDLPDYPPGATVTLTGSGFAPGESVQLQVLHNDPDSFGRPGFGTAC
ncbi:hypothetical protein [Flaviaesturariibacter aridisoli]|uniref:IPT/TIG domain-containing protein n=1 Tax=Flaviaesturariibacter aridisoli TaxID=2545761 RepID=A0A4R4DSL3_9BACT|nr:hypothetical protein [Flaviaesturariibacter aridisoli]TCZ64776.1 hypothetical protein E0486_17900 [Flaviaesturariibacter aridisoli]